MGKEIILGLMTTIFLISVASAQPSFLSNSNPNEGLQLFINLIDYHAQGEPYDFHIHLLNKSNGYPLTNDVADCYMHIYNSTGEHTFKSTTLSKDIDGFDYYIKINGGNFSDLGLHSIYYWCNSSSLELGGADKVFFEVTPTGVELKTSQSILYFISFIFLIGILFLLLYGRERLPRNKTDDEGKITEVYPIESLRPILLGLAWIVLTAITFIVANLMIGFMQTGLVGQFVFLIFKLMMLSNLLILPISIIVMIRKLVLSKEMFGLIERGVPVYGGKK